MRCLCSNQSVKKTPGDIFHTFLDLDSVIHLPVNGSVTSLLIFIQNILNYVLKTNKAFMGLERNGGKVINDKAEISDTFWGHQRLILHIVKTGHNVSPLRSQKSSALSEIISSIIFNLFYLE